MNSSKAIGGFHGLDLGRGMSLHKNAILLGSGRNCFEYVLRASKFRHAYLPKFTCDVMLEPLTKLNIPYTLYSVNDQLELEGELNLKADECLVYTNYFGLKSAYSERLSAKYGAQLVLDYSQAFYAQPPAGSQVFYSPRKFFGLPDGGCLYAQAKLEEDLPVAISHDRAGHLLRRVDLGPEAAYPTFQANEQALSGRPLERMSALTRGLLGNLDYAAARAARRANYAVLHEALGSTNGLKLELAEHDVPLAYPYLAGSPTLRGELVSRKIFVPQYWPNVLEWCDKTERDYQLSANLLPLPIDQRYGRAEMERILEVLDESLH